MKVRCASLITIRSGFMTSRIVARLESRRISFIAIRLRTSRWTSASTSASGMSTSIIRAIGRAAATIRRSHGKTFSSHQLAMSGNESSRSVSPVGRAVDDDDVVLARLVVALDLQQAEELVHPRRHAELLGGDVEDAALGEQRRRASACTAAQFASISRSACTSWPQRQLADRRRVGAELGLERVREAVRGIGREDHGSQPDAAHRRAVAAATLVFPTPPLPV